MAYLGRDDRFPIWLPGPLPVDVLADSYITLPGTEEEADDHPSRPDPTCGFIIRDWFGPFFFSTPSRFLRGRC